MDKKAASGISLALLLTSMLTLAFSVLPVKASGTIYIRADGSVDPPTAAIQRDGDVYTFADNIYDEIVVERSSIVIDGKGHIVQGAGGSDSRGISLFNMDNVTIKGTNIKGFGRGIFLCFSSGNNISGNNITANSWDGISVINPSSGNSIFGNNIAANSGWGISIWNFSSGSISGNNIADNWGGIYFGDSSGNTVSENNIANNQYGISLYISSNNEFCHNNLIDNTRQASLHPFGGGYNIWDYGYPSGGNYWSDYSSRYPGAQELDDSGIWDTPYVIDENNWDNYPLMEPWAPTPPTIVATTDIDPDTLNLKSKGKWITAYIQFPEGHSAADINATTILLNGTIAPVLDLKYGFVTNTSEYLVDHNGDGVLERMFKFDKTDVASWIHDDLGIRYGTVTLAVTGELYDGTHFEATGAVTWLFPGDADGDADVDFNDFIIFAACYGCNTENPCYVPRADFNEDGAVDFDDFIILAGNYGKTAI